MQQRDLQLFREDSPAPGRETASIEKSRLRQLVGRFRPIVRPKKSMPDRTANTPVLVGDSSIPHDGPQRRSIAGARLASSSPAAGTTSSSE